MLRRSFSTKLTEGLFHQPTIFCSSCKHLNGTLCKKFINNIDLVDGQPKYFHAQPARQDEEKCGKSAKRFEYFNHALAEFDRKHSEYSITKKMFCYVFGVEILFLLTVPEIACLIWIFPTLATTMVLVNDSFDMLGYKYIPTPNPLETKKISPNTLKSFSPNNHS